LARSPITRGAFPAPNTLRMITDTTSQRSRPKPPDRLAPQE
jgi:hypothetical protein